MSLCAACKNPHGNIKMNLLYELLLCKEHKEQWKAYKQKLKLVYAGYDKLLNAIDEEIKSRAQIGKV